jgi:anoctamin-10
MLPHVDVIIVFRAFNKPLSKKHAIECAQRAELQYTRLLKTLDAAGLRAVGRKGEKQGHLLVLVSCPLTQLASLIRQERYVPGCRSYRRSNECRRRSDFLHGLPLSKVAGAFDPQNLSPGDRLRLVHGYVTSTAQDGGLGIIPESADWDMVESVMALHDREFNETWIRSWTTRQLASVKLGRIREQVCLRIENESLLI